MTTHGGRIDEYARLSQRRVDEVLDFSANINPFGPPDSVRNAVMCAMNRIQYYPDATHCHVKSVLAHRFCVDTTSILCGNGATEVMELFLRYLSPLRLFIVQPGFSEYEAIGRRLGVPVVHAPLQRSSDGFRLPFQFIDDNIRNGDVVLLNNPHNPTGVAWPTSVWLERVLTWCRRGIPVVVDESFIDFLDVEATYTALPYLHDTSNLYIVRSATKMYAIPGLRFGFGFANPQAVPAIERDRDGWSVNQIAQAAAAAAYTDSTFAALTRTWLQQERAWIAKTWGRHPDITCYLPTVNFFLVRLPTSLFAQSLQAKLSTDGMFVRSCQDFEGLGGEYIRVAIRAHEDNQALWTLVSESLDGL